MHHTSEKEYGASHIDDASAMKSAGSDKDSHEGYVETEFTPEEQRKIIHRIDRRLVTTCGFMYCISLMDRTNLSAAAIAGMLKDLKLETGYYYSLVVLAFFITYIIFQPPCTVIVRKLGPRKFLSAIVLAWGAVMIGFGFTRNWQQLMALRIILGIFEAGFFPGCVYLLSTWYVRYDVQKRYSVFYLIGSLASALAGILAYGLMQMKGIAGLNGWRWIFIIEGILTCLIGIGGYWALIDFPEKAATSWKFLNQREIDFVVRRVDADRGDSALEPFSMKKWLSAGLDIKTWCFALIFFTITTVSYAIAYFLPIILVRGMKFSVGQGQCLVAPPYVLAGIVMFCTAWVGDKYHMRGPILIFNSVLCLIGLPLMGFHKNNAVRYFGVFLTTAGANSNVPAAMAYQANNIRGQWKRAFCSATLVGFGGVGGIAGSLVFRSQDAPRYVNGIYACIACNILLILIVCGLSIFFSIENKKAKEGRKAIEGLPGFKYTI